MLAKLLLYLLIKDSMVKHASWTNIIFRIEYY